MPIISLLNSTRRQKEARLSSTQLDSLAESSDRPRGIADRPGAPSFSEIASLTKSCANLPNSCVVKVGIF